jgi:hypothetical protein
MTAERYIDALRSNPLLRRGWQHDGREPVNPLMPEIRPQKVPNSL